MRELFDTIRNHEGYIDLIKTGQSKWQVVTNKRVSDSLVEPVQVKRFTTKQKATEYFESFRFKTIHGL